MAKFFGNLHLVLAVGLIAAILVIVSFTGWTGGDAKSVADDVFRWLHTFFGIVWIGLLYYLNFVQVPTMPKIPAEQTGAINNHIAPKVFFFFRYGALLTVLFGLVIAFHNGYGAETLTFGGEGADGINLIGLGMWLGLIMRSTSGSSSGRRSARSSTSCPARPMRKRPSCVRVRWRQAAPTPAVAADALLHGQRQPRG